jgi:N-acetylglucosaminyl-diphospho-decaprenol L-rhamnosyltransferase
MGPQFSIIIVNYNTEELLLQCIASLQAQQSFIREIIVVDNASVDHSVVMVRERFPFVHLVALQENIGFGRANNLAFEKCSGEWLFLLNPDTYLLPNCLEATHRYMVAHPEIGMAGTAVYDAKQMLQPTVNDEYPGTHYSGKLFSDLPGSIAWLLGASLVLRRAIMKHVQGFDPDYFLYGEDIDLCLRIRKAGWALGYMPEARIVHLEGQSERATPSAAVFEKKMRGELLFYQKHYPAETIRRIKNVRRLQALWRIATLWLAGLLGRENATTRTKRIKYSVAARVYR